MFLDACDTGGLPPEGVLDADLEVAGLPVLLGVLGVAGFDETMGLLGVAADWDEPVVGRVGVLVVVLSNKKKRLRL